MTAADVLRERDRIVCIVRYRWPDEGAWYNGMAAPANPAVLHQVTLFREKMSGLLIRLGETAGDELAGWQHLAALEIVQILGTVGEDGKTVTPRGGPD